MPETDHGPVVDPVDALRFEKSELHEFVVEDQYAGQNIGKLLAGVFLISFVLMSSVCVWTMFHFSQGHDPQSGIGVDVDAEHH
jgi:hypothetical protein